MLFSLLVPACASSRAVQAGALAGVWHVHTDYLTIDRHGNGTFRWPVHVFCGSGAGSVPAPCDTITARGVITDGGHARLSLTQVHGPDGSGTVSGSSENSVVPDGPVRLHLAQNDVLELTFQTTPSVGAYVYLCGPGTDRARTNCGA